MCAGYGLVAQACADVAYCSTCVCWLWFAAARVCAVMDLKHESVLVIAQVCAVMVNYSMCVCWLWFSAALGCAGMVYHNITTCVCAGMVLSSASVC